MTRMSVAEAKQLGILHEQKKHKYGAIKTIIDGIPFASKKEAAKYRELKLLKMAGEIIGIELQPEFVLQDAYIRHGKAIRAIVYRADFRVTYNDGRVVVMDVKPSKTFQTKEYRIKKKLLLFKYPDLVFKEVY